MTTTAPTDRLAINGGIPVRTAPFGGWPQWGEEEEQALVRERRRFLTALAMSTGAMGLAGYPTGSPWFWLCVFSIASLVAFSFAVLRAYGLGKAGNLVPAAGYRTTAAGRLSGSEAGAAAVSPEGQVAEV